MSWPRAIALAVALVVGVPTLVVLLWLYLTAIMHAAHALARAMALE